MIIYATPEQVDELLKQRDSIQSCFTITRSVSYPSGSAYSAARSKSFGDDYKSGSSDFKEKSMRKKWFSLKNLRTT